MLSLAVELHARNVYDININVTHTGTKFLLVTAPQQANVDPYMKKIYDIYSDYVMKNPFQPAEMPIRSDQFDQSLLKFIETINGP